MRDEMSKALGPERFVVIRAIPSRRERFDQVGTSGYSMRRKRVRTIDKIDQTVPTGRVLFLLSSRHFVPGYLHKVPTGRKPLPALRAFSSHHSTTPSLQHSFED